MENEIIKFNRNGLELDVKVTPDKDTVWLTLDQMAYLYKKDRSTIGHHVRNIFKEGELDEMTSGDIIPRSSNEKKRPPKIYNLDVIISVGYRVKSPVGIAFRKWASGVLKAYIIKGAAINEKRLLTLGKTIDIQSRMLARSLDVETDEIYIVIEAYDHALSLLDDYDHQVVIKPSGTKTSYELSYKECCDLVNNMPFAGKSAVFGVEKEHGKVAGILAAVFQNVFGQEVYPTLEEKAANLLYFLIKDHPYADGCKRISACVFLQFLHKNDYLYIENHKRISNGALVAITLMIAESDPIEKDIMINLVMNLLTKKD